MTRACMMTRPSPWPSVPITCLTPTRARKAGSGWARQKAIDAGAIVIDGQPPAMPMPQPRAAVTAAIRRAGAPDPGPEPRLEGVVLDPAAARKRARDEAFRASPDAIMMRIMNGG